MTNFSRRNFLRGGLAALGTAALNACTSDPEDVETPSTDTSNMTAPTPEIPPVTDPIPDSVQDVSVRLVWTGDIHGHLRPIYHRDQFDETYLAEQGIEKGSKEAYISSSVDYEALAAQYGLVGGWANMAAVIKELRSEYPDGNLLLDSGDTWYGSAIALKTQGRACVEVMNAIGYDALTLHWEFNLGAEEFLARVDESNYAVLAQNLVDTDFEDRILEPSLIRDINGTRVAVVGQAYPFSLLTTEDPELTPNMRMGYRDFELQKELDRVREEEGAELVILLSHMGYAQDIAMAQILEGVDVIVGGHTHDILWQPVQVGQTLILQAGSHGKLVGKIDLEVSGGKLVGYDHQLFPILADEIEADPEIEALIDEWYAPFEEEFSEVIGETTSLLYRSSLFGGTSDAYMGSAYRAIVGSDLSCTGGWRFGSTLLPGPVTVEDVYNVFKPTPSPLYTAVLLGSQILESIEDNLDNVYNSDPLQRLGGDVLRCTGIKADFLPNGQRMARLIEPKVGGEALDEIANYTVATSGGRTQLRDPSREATDRSAVEELIDYIRENPTMTADNPVQAFTPIT